MKKNINLNMLIPLIFLISALSLSIPYGFPLFAPTVFIILFYAFLTRELKIRINIQIILFFLCVLFYLMAILFNDGAIYNKNIDDIQNIISFTMIIALLSSINYEEYKNTIKNFFKFASWMFLFISILSLIKFYLLNNGIQIGLLKERTTTYPWGTSLISDYNLFTFALSVGVLSSIYNLRNTKSYVFQIIYLTTSFLCMLSILLSASRRGWVILILLLVYFIFEVIKLSHKDPKFRNTLIASTLVFFILFINFIDIKGLINSMNLDIYEYRFRSIIMSEGFSSREGRWAYAIELLKNYNPLNLFIGNGFNYLEIYANKFTIDLTEDYPHSPLLSSLLYSGIIGFTIVVFFFVSLVNKLLINKRNISKEIILLFIISVAYTSISGNSIFSNSLAFCIFIIIMMIPAKTPNQKKDGLYEA